jgi:DNA invertase Pin-like site-specific DNA recombinase
MKTTEGREAKVYVYERWSSAAQTDGDSDRRQNDLAVAWCARRDVALAGCEKDGGVSGWKGKNRSEGSALSRLLKIVKPGDYLLIEDCDRLSRQDWLTSLNFIAEIVAKGVTVVTLDNGGEIDAERLRRDPGCFLPVILRAHLGNDEIEKKSKRVKESWAARKAQIANGVPANMHLPCWLRWSAKGPGNPGKPVVHEDCAKTVREMFRLSLQGLGCQAIARKLNQEHWTLKNGIAAPYVWRTLRNPMVIGTCPYVQPPRPGVYPTIVDEQVYYRVQAQLDRNKKRTTPRRSANVNLTTGLLFCSKCGGPVNLFTQYGNGNRIYRYLVCADSRHRNGGCGMRSLRYDHFETSLMDLLSNSPLIRRALVAQKEPEVSPVAVLAGELADAQRQTTKIMAMIDGDPNPAKALALRLKDWEAKAEGLRAQIADEEAKAKAQAKSPVEALAELRDMLPLKPDDREKIKVALPGLIQRITIELGQDRYIVQFIGGGRIDVKLAIGEIGELALVDLHNSPDLTSFRSIITK